MDAWARIIDVRCTESWSVRWWRILSLQCSDWNLWEQTRPYLTKLESELDSSKLEADYSGCLFYLHLYA